MEEKNKAIAGCIVFATLILILGIGGYIFTFGSSDHKTDNEIKQEKLNENKISNDKDFIYFENDNVISSELNVAYKDVVVNLVNPSAKAVSEELNNESKVFSDSIKKISETEADPEKEIKYNTDDIYSATLRNYETFDYKNYVSLVVTDKEYDCYEGVKSLAKIKAYVFDTKKNERVSSMDLLLKYNTSLNDIKQTIKTTLEAKQTTDDEGNPVIKIDETLDSITGDNVVLYINDSGVLILKYVVKSNVLDYNDTMEIS